MRSAAVLACLLALAAPAGADFSARDVARAHDLAGRSRYAAGDYEEALREFRRSYEIQPRPALLVNIGQCLRKLGRDDEAAAIMQRFIDARVGPPGVRGEVVETVDEVLAGLDERLYKVAEAAAQIERELERTDLTPAARNRLRLVLRAVLSELAAIDDGLASRFGPMPRAAARPAEPPVRTAEGKGKRAR